MKELNNYKKVYNSVTRKPLDNCLKRAVIHKNTGRKHPRVSFILLDWKCRERFNTLDWLNRQDVSRDDYELIWVELYDRILPEVMEKADVVITCHQQGMYHKHKGYNIGALFSHGEFVVICDSDAVFPPNFVRSIYQSFKSENLQTAIPMVLMHHEYRTSFLYPETLSDTKELMDEKWKWWDLVPNCGACLTFRKQDIIRFGGFDEHKSYRGYLCGGYELAWRLVNAGWPEVWHDTSVVLWHFAHPDPVGSNQIRPTFRALCENRHPHVDLHAINAVEAASIGRFLPLLENSEIWRMRMDDRHFGTDFEAKYGVMTGQEGFPCSLLFLMRVKLLWNIMCSTIINKASVCADFISSRFLGKRFKKLFKNIKFALGFRSYNMQPVLIESINGFNLIDFKGEFYGIPQCLGAVDFFDENQVANPLIMKSKTLIHLKKCIAIENQSVMLDPFLEEVYRGHNIIKYRKVVYAIPQNIGPVDLNDKKVEENSNILQAHTIEHAKELIDRSFLETKQDC